MLGRNALGRNAPGRSTLGGGTLGRRAAIGAPGIAALALACQGILGIEELNVESRPGSGGTSGAGGDGAIGNDGGTAGSLAAGGSGAADDGGGSGGDGMSVAMGGSTALPSPDAGVADAGDGDGAIVVSGRVIDFFRRPLADVPVTIGSTTVATDADGRFTIPEVEGPYTASLMLNMIRGGGTARYGWVFEGLTRDDPTLQVYSALPSRSTSSITLSYQDITLEPDLHYAIVAWSSPDGQFAVEEASRPVQYLGVPSWTGPASTSGTIHALDAFRDVAGEPPVAYQAYQALPLTVGDGGNPAVNFSLPFDPSIVTGSVAGTIAHSAIEPNSNFVALVFADGTAMPLIDEIEITPEFSYFAPALPDTSLTVAAADGSSGFPPYAVAHQGNVAVGQSDVALSVPRPVNLSAPQPGAPVDPSTTYSWSALGQTAQTFLWHLEFDATYEGMFVLTSRTQIELPRFADGFTVPPGVAVTWSVETHGDAPDVDALASPNGYLDAFSVGTTYPIGPNRADGYYTESERRGFTMNAAD